MQKRDWIKALLAGEKDLPIPQHWMSFFNGDTARKLTPPQCHYYPMWIYDVPDHYDMTPMEPEALDRMIEFNNHSGRCFACLGKGANICFGHGGPGEFYSRMIHRDDNELIVEYETGVRAKVQFDPHFYHHFDHPIKTSADLDNMEWPDPNDPKRYEGFAQDVAYLKSKGEYVLASLNGFFSGIHYFLMEYTETLMGLLDQPELIEAITNRLGEWNLAAARKMIENGADCIALCDDLGSKKSLLMAPDLYRRFFKPWHKRLCETVHELGGHVHLHTHGAVAKIMDDLVECNFDFINPFDPEEKHDIPELMKNHGNHFIIVGGFPTSFWVWEPERQEAYLEQMAAWEKQHARGRLIFMDSGGVPDDITRQDFERINTISRRVRGLHPGDGFI